MGVLEVVPAAVYIFVQYIGGLGDSRCDCLIAFYLLFVNVASTIFLSNPGRHASFYLYSERTVLPVY